MNIVIRENIFFLLYLFLPISIILGSTISLINVIFLNLCFLIFLISQRKFEFIKHISIKLMLILYLYLIFNSLISVNYEIGLSRNIGFIRLIILFVFINYFFFYHKNEKKVFDRGHGLFKKTHDDLILTEANKTRSRWKLPAEYFLNTEELFLNRMKWENEKESTIFYKGFGQEFILDIEKNPSVMTWAVNLIKKHG